MLAAVKVNQEEFLQWQMSSTLMNRVFVYLTYVTAKKDDESIERRPLVQLRITTADLEQSLQIISITMNAK